MAKLSRAEKRLLSEGKRGVVAFDFDGTISDTVLETYVQALKAYTDLGGKLKHSSAIEKQYRQARPLITKAEHLFSILRLIESNPKINFDHITQEQMNSAFKADAERQKPFLEKFYAHRKHMQEHETKKWGGG
ncbi:MAG: hypothetical protein WCI04_03770 [archaeon]